MTIANADKTGHSEASEAVTRRYKAKSDPTDMDRQNLDRVRTIIRLFEISVKEVAKAGGVSRPYLSRALGGTLVPSSKFWRTLEENLGRLVEEREGQVFGIPVTECEEVLRGL